MVNLSEKDIIFFDEALDRAADLIRHAQDLIRMGRVETAQEGVMLLRRNLEALSIDLIEAVAEPQEVS